MEELNQKIFYAEAILSSQFGKFFVSESKTPVEAQNLLEKRADCHKVETATEILTSMGFKVVASSPFSLSIIGSQDLFVEFFNTTITQQFGVSDSNFTYWSPPTNEISQPMFTKEPQVNWKLEDEIETLFIPPLAGFLSSTPWGGNASAPTPPANPTYVLPKFPLKPAFDLCDIINATNVPRKYRGSKVGVAMLDTGLYWKHDYFQNNGALFHNGSLNNGGKYYDPFIYNSAGKKLSGNSAYKDTFGHGTGMASNLLGVAPDIDFHFIKMNELDALIAFKNARDIFKPNVISCSWFVRMASTTTGNAAQDDQARAQNDKTMLLWEVEIELAVQNSINVLFAVGNKKPIPDYPSCSQNVISVGGVFPQNFGGGIYSLQNIGGGNFTFLLSDYTTSGVNLDYDRLFNINRHCPDVSGLCGPQLYGWLIGMPTDPKSTVDENSSTSGDGTATDDGWVVGSGSSAATAQVAGAVAAMLSKNKSLTPNQIKTLLTTSANVSTVIDYPNLTNAAGKKVSEGAVGSGLINVEKLVAAVP